MEETRQNWGSNTGERSKEAVGFSHLGVQFIIDILKFTEIIAKQVPKVKYSVNKRKLLATEGASLNRMRRAWEKSG